MCGGTPKPDTSYQDRMNAISAARQAESKAAESLFAPYFAPDYRSQRETEYDQINRDQFTRDVAEATKALTQQLFSTGQQSSGASAMAERRRQETIAQAERQYAAQRAEAVSKHLEGIDSQRRSVLGLISASDAPAGMAAGALKNIPQWVPSVMAPGSLISPEMFAEFVGDKNSDGPQVSNTGLRLFSGAGGTPGGTSRIVN